MIISVHLPKTAGTSFAKTLERHFGSALMRDYADKPLHTPEDERNRAALEAGLHGSAKNFERINCIHGHFLPIKYQFLSEARDVTFIAWMRNPVERVLSHYYFWKRSYRPWRTEPLHRKMIKEKWTVERFCLGPELKNMYSQFLYRFPIEDLGFIGITEHYDEDFAFFCERYLDSHIKPEKLNVGKSGGAGYRIEASLREKIKEYHAKDMELYNRALERRSTRIV